ncbi:MAG: YdcF family protein [Rhizobacter sp.]
MPRLKGDIQSMAQVIKSLILFIASLMVFVYCELDFHYDKSIFGREVFHHPLTILWFLAGIAFVFASVYSRLRGPLCLVGMAILPFTSMLYLLYDHEDVFTGGLLVLIVLGTIPLGAGYLSGYWMAIASKVILVPIVGVRKAPLFLLGAVMVYLVPAAVLSVIGLNDHEATADVILVPRDTIEPGFNENAIAGAIPSDRLRKTLEIAVRLFHEGRAPIIFVSGAIDKNGICEACAMSDYLTAFGIPITAIAQDPLGVDIAMTASNTAVYLHARKLQTAVVVAPYFHVARISLALKRNGVTVTGTSHARYIELRDVYSLAREVVAYAVYCIKL